MKFYRIYDVLINLDNVLALFLDRQENTVTVRFVNASQDLINTYDSLEEAVKAFEELSKELLS